MNNTDVTTAKRFRAPGPKGMIRRVLVILAAGILAVTAINVGCGPEETKENAASSEETKDKTASPDQTKDTAASPGSASPGLEGRLPNSAVVTVEEAKRALEYWTPKRMANATPVPLPEAPNTPSRKNGGTRAEVITRAQEWRGDATRPPATTTGKLFGRVINDPRDPNDDEDGGCSASTVDSPAKNLVFTAGHCVLTSGPHRNWVRNLVYVPGYRYRGGDPRAPENEPYGEWSARTLVPHYAWMKEEDYGYDVAAITVYPSNITGGERLVDVVGANSIGFNLPAEQDTYAFGYPSNYANAGVLHYCQGQSRWNGTFDPRRQSLSCDMYKGVSGGPWLTAFGGEHGVLHSVTSLVSRDGSRIQGILFDNSVKQLYNGVVGTDPSPDSRIAYSHFDGTDYEIYTMKGDGSSQFPRTTNDTDDREPAYSPSWDINKIAYSGRDGTDYEIYRLGLPQVTTNDTDDRYPDYSPDGKRIAYSGFDGHDYEIYTRDISGGTPDRVTDNDTDDFGPSYSPDGKRIAYSGFDGIEGNDYEIYTRDTSGGTPVQVTKNTTNDFDPDYGSNYGPSIAYSGFDGHDYEIYRAGFQVTYNDTDDRDPSYSPNSPHIAYEGFDGHDLEIYRINFGWGHVRQLTNNDTDDRDPSWGISSGF